MIKCFKLIAVSFSVFLMVSCSDSSGNTVSRNLDDPAFNLTAPNFTGNSSASAPTLSTVSTFSVEGTIVSNVVSDSDARHYVLSKNGASLVLHVICESSNINCSSGDQFSIALDTDSYINLLIDSNRTVYFSVDDNLYALPTSIVSGPGGLIDLQISMDSTLIPILDNRGHIILFKNTPNGELFSIYNILDVNNNDTSLELIHEHTNAINIFSVPPIIIEDKLYIHSTTGLIQYDLLNSYNVTTSSNDLQLGDTPIRVFYDKSNDLLVYEYASVDDDTVVKSGLRLFSVETGGFVNPFNYTDSNRIKSLLGINKNGVYKFIFEDTPSLSIDIIDYGFVNNEISSLNEPIIAFCRDDANPFFVRANCTDTLSSNPLYKLSVAFFDGDNSMLFGAWVLRNVGGGVDSKIKLKKTGSNTNSISTGTVQTDTLLINDDMSSYLNDLFPTAESKLQMAYYTFDRPAVVNGAVIIRSSNKLFIVR